MLPRAWPRNSAVIRLEKDRPAAHQKNVAEAEYICFFPVLLSSHMKLPSLHHVAAEAARVGRRFPLTLLCSLLLGAVSTYYQRLDHEQSTKLDWLFPVLSAAGLGLTLTLNVALAGERYRWPWWDGCWRQRVPWASWYFGMPWFPPNPT